MLVYLILLPKFNLPLIGAFTWLTSPRPYRATICRERNWLWITYVFFDHKRTWRAFPNEGSAQCRGPPPKQHEHERRCIPVTHPFILTRRIWKDDYDGQMMFGDFMGLKLPDICLTGEEKLSPRKSVPTGDRTRARCVTGVHATAYSTAVDKLVQQMHNFTVT